MVLMGVGGMCVGGVVSMLKAGRKWGALVCGGLGAVAILGAVAWWWPYS